MGALGKQEKKILESYFWYSELMPHDSTEVPSTSAQPAQPKTCCASLSQVVSTSCNKSANDKL